MTEDANMQNLIDELAESHGLSRRNAENFVKHFFERMEEALEKEGRVAIAGLGEFNLTEGEGTEGGWSKGIRFTSESRQKDLCAAAVLTTDQPAPAADPASMDEEDAAGQPAEEVAATAAEDVTGEEKAGEAMAGADTAGTETPQQDGQETQSEELPTPPAHSTDEVPQAVAALKLSEEKKNEILRKAEGASTPYFIIFMVIVILACLGVVAYLYHPNLLRMFGGTPPAHATEAVEGAAAAARQPSVGRPAESALAAAAETVAVQVPEATLPAGGRPETKEQPAVQPAATFPLQLKENAQYNIQGTLTTYVVKKGERLADVAKRFYGVRGLYTYIVTHNKDVIKNPDNVPYGTTIKIPKLVEK